MQQQYSLIASSITSARCVILVFLELALLSLYYVFPVCCSIFFFSFSICYKETIFYLHASPLSFSPLPSRFVKMQSGYGLLVRTLSVWKQQGAQRSPFREEKNKYKHVTNTFTFTLHTTSSVWMRSIGMQTAACHHAHKQINNTGNTSYPLAQCSPHFVFDSLPLLWCSHLSRLPAGTDFLSPTHAQFYRKSYAFLTDTQVKKQNKAQQLV